LPKGSRSGDLQGLLQTSPSSSLRTVPFTPAPVDGLIRSVDFPLTLICVPSANRMPIFPYRPVFTESPPVRPCCRRASIQSFSFTKRTQLSPCTETISASLGIPGRWRRVAAETATTLNKTRARTRRKALKYSRAERKGRSPKAVTLSTRWSRFSDTETPPRTTPFRRLSGFPSRSTAREPAERPSPFRFEGMIQDLPAIGNIHGTRRADVSLLVILPLRTGSRTYRFPSILPLQSTEISYWHGY
jgi:hypothetical protein